MFKHLKFKISLGKIKFSYNFGSDTFYVLFDNLKNSTLSEMGGPHVKCQLVEKILTYSSFNLNKFRYKQTYTGIKEGC